VKCIHGPFFYFPPLPSKTDTGGTRERDTVAYTASKTTFAARDSIRGIAMHKEASEFGIWSTTGAGQGSEEQFTPRDTIERRGKRENGESGPWIR